MAPCRFFNAPGGCRRGSSCHFTHDRGSSSGRGGRSQGRNPKPSSGNVPKDVCKNYWTDGSCNRGFQCKFKHIKRDSAGRTAESSPSSPSTSRLDAIDAISPYLTEEGLAKLSLPGTDVFFADDTPMSPSQVQNNLRRFLRDDFRFRKTFDIYAFVGLLNNAGSNHDDWVSAQLFLALSSL
jgi:hypothetical protein